MKEKNEEEGRGVVEGGEKGEKKEKKSDGGKKKR